VQRLRKIGRYTAAALLLVVAGAAVGEDQECAHLWDGERAPIVVAPTTAAPAAVAINGLLTEAGSDDFSHPSTVQESNCALDLI
jgi:hypothetical protein